MSERNKFHPKKKNENEKLCWWAWAWAVHRTRVVRPCKRNKHTEKKQPKNMFTQIHTESRQTRTHAHTTTIRDVCLRRPTLVQIHSTRYACEVKWNKNQTKNRTSKRYKHKFSAAALEGKLYYIACRVVFCTQMDNFSTATGTNERTNQRLNVRPTDRPSKRFQQINDDQRILIICQVNFYSSC